MPFKKLKSVNICQYCNEPFEAFFEKQKYCSRNCMAKARYHREHPDAKYSVDHTKSLICDMNNCEFYTLHRNNKCSALHTVPIGYCRFYKKVTDGSKVQEEDEEE